jgi:hypothetical protein
MLFFQCCLLCLRVAGDVVALRGVIVITSPPHDLALDGCFVGTPS